MKRLFYTIVVALAMICPLQSCANGGGTKSEVSAPEPEEIAESSDLAESVKKTDHQIRVEGLLKDARQQKASTNFPLFFARQLLDVPYVAHTLEVNDEEQSATFSISSQDPFSSESSYPLCLSQGVYL